MQIEKQQIGGYEAFMTLTTNGIEYKFYFNMKGYKANFSLKNKDGVYYHFKETTEQQQIKALKTALKQGFNQLTNY